MKNKKYYLIGFLSLIFIINTILVICKVYNPVDSFIHDMFMRLYSSSTTKIMKIFTFFGSTLFIIILSVLLFIFFLLRKKKSHAITTVGLIITSTLINNIVKLIIRRPRPTLNVMVIEKSFSYPSGHTMASTTIYGFLIYLIIKSNISMSNKILFTSLLSLLILLVASSRIYLGAHFFSDVFGGCLLSSVIILVFSIIDDKKKILK